jgi:hypothetical protein
MLKRTLDRIALLVFFSLAPCAARAIPFYQLDIAGGSYDPVSESIVTGATRFTLFAYAKPRTADDLVLLLTQPSHLSIAIGASSGAGDLGSFRVNGQVVLATGDMRFGVPPYEPGGGAAPDPGDLASHGLGETWFVQKDFLFSTTRQSALYDTAQHAGSGPRPGSGMLYTAFGFDTSGLAPGTSLHFDLYSTRTKNGDVDIANFAPFSHDASTIASRIRPVPEPTAALMFGIGFLAIAFAHGPRPSGRTRAI